MTNHWAIAIGINQYQFFQPLSFAQRDAQALRNILVEQAGFAADRCLLLTESSPPVLGRPTYPSRENLQGWIELLSRNFLQPGDQLWCFFSGYGVCFEGEDYLVPIEGNPHAIPQTSVPLQSLFSSLKAAPLETALVLLDMNRSQAATHEAVGVQTAELATDLEIATILSCQPGQFSREVPSLGHGFFTAALLESLQFQRSLTLGSLDHYLSGRLPELSEHYWRPLQQPLTIVNPPEKRDRLILPKDVKATTQRAAPTEIRLTADPAPSSKAGERILTVPATAKTGTPPSSVNAAGKQVPPPQEQPPTTSPPKLANAAIDLPPPSTSSANRQNTSAANESDLPDPLLWRRMILGGATLVAVLLLGVIWRNWDVLTTAKPAATSVQTPRSPQTPSIANSIAPPTKPAAVTPSPSQVNTVAASPIARAKPQTPPNAPQNQQSLQAARNLIQFGQASQYNKAIAKAREVQPGDPLYADAQKNIRRWSQVILNLAKRRAERGAYTDAIFAARLVPSDQTKPYAEAQRSIGQWQKQLQQNSKVVLSKAKKLIRRGQASSYSQAITLAQTIQPNQPGYQEAQTLTNRWSQTILELAKSRAEQRRYTLALQTAALVPQNTAAYAQAQQAIARWRQQARR